MAWKAEPWFLRAAEEGASQLSDARSDDKGCPDGPKRGRLLNGSSRGGCTGRNGACRFCPRRSPMSREIGFLRWGHEITGVSAGRIALQTSVGGVRFGSLHELHRAWRASLARGESFWVSARNGEPRAKQRRELGRRRFASPIGTCEGFDERSPTGRRRSGSAKGVTSHGETFGNGLGCLALGPRSLVDRRVSDGTPEVRYRSSSEGGQCPRWGPRHGARFSRRTHRSESHA